jgi:uncharacterized membrane protein
MAQSSPAWAQRIEHIAHWILRHWLVCANGLVLLYGGIPWLSPLAYANGYPLIGWFLFAIYRPLCHQIPERSFFLYGYQVAYCHRETAMYTALFIGGLLFAFFRERVRPISLRLAGLLLLPMLLDGGSHLLDDLVQIGFRNTGATPGSLNFWLRMFTGLLFALAVLLAVYPRVDRDLRKAGMLGSNEATKHVSM